MTNGIIPSKKYRLPPTSDRMYGAWRKNAKTGP